MIVVGVLVALAVDEYRANAEQEARLEAYLVQLDAEFASNTAEAERVLRLVETDFQNGTRLMEGLGLNPMPASDSLATWLTGSLSSVSWEPQLGTLNAMVESGGLFNIADPGLQAALIRFRDAPPRFSRSTEGALSILLDGAGMVAERADFRVVLGPPHFGIEPTGREWDWQRLAEDPAFGSGIYLIANSQRNNRGALQSLLDELKLVQAAIARAR